MKTKLILKKKVVFTFKGKKINHVKFFGGDDPTITITMLTQTHFS